MSLVAFDKSSRSNLNRKYAVAPLDTTPSAAQKNLAWLAFLRCGYSASGANSYTYGSSPKAQRTTAAIQTAIALFMFPVGPFWEGCVYGKHCIKQAHARQGYESISLFLARQNSQQKPEVTKQASSFIVDPRRRRSRICVRVRESNASYPPTSRYQLIPHSSGTPSRTP